MDLIRNVICNLYFIRVVENDFDMMKRKKKELYGSRRRKRKSYDVINENDDLIAEMIENMKHAAEVLLNICVL